MQVKNPDIMQDEKFLRETRKCLILPVDLRNPRFQEMSAEAGMAADAFVNASYNQENKILAAVEEQSITSVFNLLAIDKKSKSPVGSGSVTLHPLDDHGEVFGWLDGVYIKPDYRQSGIAKALYETRLLWAKMQKCKEVMTIIRSDNTAALHLCEKFGFQCEAEFMCAWGRYTLHPEQSKALVLVRRI